MLMETAKQEQRSQNRVQMENASTADVDTSTVHSPWSSPIIKHGDDLQEGNEFVQSISWEELNSNKLYPHVSLGNDQQRRLLTFPEGEGDAVTITNKDLESLQPTRLLSGNIINFYIKYLQRGFSSMDKDRFHFFNSFFFTKLMENHNASMDSDQRQVAFEKVQKWTGEVDLFEKSYVFIPVKRSSHWSLIILCHLSSLTSSPDKFKSPPCILHLDSAEGKHGSFEDPIRRYILQAWMERYHDPNMDQLLALSQMKYNEAKVPQQDKENDYDCGLYLLHYVEFFLLESRNISIASSQEIFHFALWDTPEVSAKRKDIINVILELSLQSTRNSRELQTRLSRLTQLSQEHQTSSRDKAVSEVHVEKVQINLRPSHAQGDEIDHIGHQTTAAEAALDNQQEGGAEIHHDDHQINHTVAPDNQQQCEELPCILLKPQKERNKRGRNWTKDETSVLLKCKLEGGRFCKGNQATTDWMAISQEIEGKLGTTPSEYQCRLRYDTLLKAYKTTKNKCTETTEKERGVMKLATTLTEEWYNTIDKICHRSLQEGRSQKRAKLTSRVDNSPFSSSPCSVPPSSPPTQIPTPSPESCTSTWEQDACALSNEAMDTTSNFSRSHLDLVEFLERVGERPQNLIRIRVAKNLQLTTKFQHSPSSQFQHSPSSQFQHSPFSQFQHSPLSQFQHSPLIHVDSNCDFVDSELWSS